jgi:hypothetical protein
MVLSSASMFCWKEKEGSGWDYKSRLRPLERSLWSSNLPLKTVLGFIHSVGRPAQLLHIPDLDFGKHLSQLSSLIQKVRGGRVLFLWSLSTDWTQRQAGIIWPFVLKAWLGVKQKPCPCRSLALHRHAATPKEQWNAYLFYLPVPMSHSRA